MGTEFSSWVKEIPAVDYQFCLNDDFQVGSSQLADIGYKSAILFLLFESRLHFSDLELFNWRDHIEFTSSVRSHAIAQIELN